MLSNGNWSCVSTQSLSVILTGIVIVFLMLLLLIITIKLVSLIVGGFEKIGKNRSTKKAAKKAAKKTDEAAAKPAATASVPAAPQASGTNGGVIAAISAAVAMMLGHQGFKIASIRRAGKGNNGRSTWKMAGMQDNTRPF